MRFALLMAMAVLALGLVNRIYFETRFLREFEAELEWRALGVSRQLTHDAVDFVFYQDWVGLQRLLAAARDSTPDFAYAFVLNPKGEVLAHTFEGGFPNALRYINSQRDADQPSVQRVNVFGATYRDIAAPLHGGTIGVLRLGVSDARLLARVERVRQELWLILFAATLVSAVGAYLFTWMGLSPIAAVAAALQRFQPGRRRDEIRLRRNDEIGDLAAKVNEVTARLDETHRRLAHTEKMVSIGIMASGIAHEINNPLTGIQNCLRRIQDDPEDQAQTTEYAEVMLKATEHIEAVVRGLLDFSHATAHQMVPVDLRSIVSRALDLVNLRLSKRAIEVVRHEPEEAVMVTGDSVQLTQVLINLIVNAMDAMPDSGTLTVTVAPAPERAELRVRDTGVGIAAEHLPRVFDPFFTTKEVGKGTGLGLAVTHGIVTDHGGTIDIQSELGQGTEVTVRLPLRPPVRREK